MTYSRQLLKAQELIYQNPLPDDIEQQLEALQKQAPESEQIYFGDLWSSLKMLKPIEPDL